MASILNVDKIRATGSTTDGLTIDSSGRVFTPARPAFHTNAKESATSDGNPVVWTSVDFDISGSYSTTTGKFTAPVAGIYQFQFNLFFSSFNPAQVEMVHTPSGGSAVLKSEIKSQGFAGQYHVLSDSRCLQLGVGDTVHVRKSSGTILNTNNGKFGSFSGFLVG